MGMSGRETLTISKSEAKRCLIQNFPNRSVATTKIVLLGEALFAFSASFFVLVFFLAFVKRHLSNLLSYFFFTFPYTRRKTIFCCPITLHMCKGRLCIGRRKCIFNVVVFFPDGCSHPLCPWKQWCRIPFVFDIPWICAVPGCGHRSSLRGGTEAIGLLRTNPTMHRPSREICKTKLCTTAKQRCIRLFLGPILSTGCVWDPRGDDGFVAFSLFLRQIPAWIELFSGTLSPVKTALFFFKKGWWRGAIKTEWIGLSSFGGLWKALARQKQQLFTSICVQLPN